VCFIGDTAEGVVMERSEETRGRSRLEERSQDMVPPRPPAYGYSRPIPR
jgi:hypothetical protein